MKPKPLDAYRANLHILSPVHIGTGQEIDPFSYIIRDGTLFWIDLVRWMESYPDSKSLNVMMDSDNFAIIRSFIADKFDMPEAVLDAIPIDNPTLVNTYQKAIQERNPKNQVLISPMTRNPLTLEPYIPGSSIKGAIRTAIANRFVKAANVTNKDVFRMEYNKKIFGGIKDDPMGYLKISDVPLGKSSTVIVEAKEYPLNPSKPLTPKGNMEVTYSLCHKRTPVIHPLNFSMAAFTLHEISIDMQFILDALYDFYVDKYVAEFDKFYRSDPAADIQHAMHPMNQALINLKTNETLIRIGHFSHVECVTLDKVRLPKTRNGKDGKPLPWGITRTLANGIYPFGWAKLEFPDIESRNRPKREWNFPPVSEVILEKSFKIKFFKKSHF